MLMSVVRRNEKGDAIKVTTRVRVTKVQKKLYKVSSMQYSHIVFSTKFQSLEDLSC